MITDRNNQVITTKTEVQTVATGKELARILHDSDVIAFSGPLGAGKTTFIKGIACGLGIGENDVKSPSYTLVNEYPGLKPLYHFDLYRMKNSSELYEIGWDDYLLRDGIIVVEWGEKARDALPQKRIEILMEIVSQSERKISISFIED